MPGKKRSGFANDRKPYRYGGNPEPQLPSCTASAGCSNGYPINIYANCNLISSQALYTAWCSYQSQYQSQFSTLQNNSMAPTTEGNPSGPANIFIIRHGEKASGYGMDANGIFRASQLANYIISLSNNGYPISYIITCQPDSYQSGGGSMHPSQLVSAASFLLNIPIIMYGVSSDTSTTAQNLYNGQFDGLNVLICWEHLNIQNLCLEILNDCPTTRLPTGCNNADEFFLNLSPSPFSGNYLCTTNSKHSNTSYIAPPPENNGNYTNPQNYPYWNVNDFSTVYVFSSASPSYQYDFTISNENINTCSSECNLHIGLYQPTNGESYYDNGGHDIEQYCQAPTDWATS